MPVHRLRVILLMLIFGLVTTPIHAEKPTPAPITPNWWSLRPLTLPSVPTVSAELTKWGRTPIDRFIAAKWGPLGFVPSPEADRRTLLRRLTLDLTGLPPTPEELIAFQNDTAPNAYEKVVDRLLASPRYGERWARHWLDVAHYADSHGQDQDRARPNAWPFRDAMIRAFNEDRPYARFIQDQIAGDVLFPEDPHSIASTGFLAAGPFDESSLVSIREDSIDRLIAQYLDRDDIASSAFSTFAGLTLGCARCHDHKFDPISQDDYYAVQAVFAGIDKADRPYDSDPVIARKRLAIRSQLTQLKAWTAQVVPELLTAERKAEVAAFEAERVNSGSRWIPFDVVSIGAKHGTTFRQLPDRTILATGTAPDKDTYMITLAAPTATMLTGIKLEVLPDASLPMNGPGRQGNGNLHLSEVRVRLHSRTGTSPAAMAKLKTAIADFDQAGWGILRAIDGVESTAWGIHPAIGMPHEAIIGFESPLSLTPDSLITIELDQLHGMSHLIGKFRLSGTTAKQPFDAINAPLPAGMQAILNLPAPQRTPAQQAELARQIWERRLDQEMLALPTPQHVYSGTNVFKTDGSFRPVTTPRPVHVLKRGEVTRPLKLAAPGAVTAVPGVPARFTLTNPADEGQRRVALAKWLSDANNPLPWRVMVNRVWQHHFGVGIVDTPNDLGKMGGTPSHPELLDWLAIQFRDNGGSVKSLHRMIVTSSVYRQSSQHNAMAATKDQDNRLLWRMNRRRLDAESVRDSVLQIAGRLDLTMGGPPVQQFVMTPGKHVTADADYANFDVDRPEARRRSIYRFAFRTRPDPLLEALDCPDTSLSAPVRSQSMSALQALALWNNAFTLRHAEHLAELAVKSTPVLADQVNVVSLRVLNRVPTANEAKLWTSFAQKHGLANWCRVMLNSSEFLFID